MYFLGIDLGTSGIKAGIITAQGELLASSYWETKIISNKPGEMKQSIDDFLLNTLKIIKEVVQKAGISAKLIAGLAMDGQMGGVIGIDENYESVTGLDMNLDMSSSKYSIFMHERLGINLTKITCGSPLNGQKILWWKDEHPGVYKQIRKFITLNAYVAGRMASLESNKAFIDHTLLAFFGLESAADLSWSKEICSELDVDPEKLPRIVKSWEKIGVLTSECAGICGLNQGTPIFAGCGDQAAGFLGAGFIHKDTVFDVSGSTSLISRYVDNFVPDVEKRTVMYIPSVKQGAYNAFVYINGGGINLNWFVENIIGKTDADSDKNKLYDILSAEAEDVPPGSDGILFIPYMGGRQCPFDTRIRGGWLGLNWGHKRGHLYRAILEAIAYTNRQGVERMREMFPEIKINQVYVTGGGAKNDLWNRIKSDVIGLPYESIEGYDAAIRGGCMIAAYGLGTYKDWETVITNMKNNKKENDYYPDMNNYRKYSNYFDVYKNIFEKTLQETMHESMNVNK